MNNSYFYETKSQNRALLRRLPKVTIFAAEKNNPIVKQID